MNTPNTPAIDSAFLAMLQMIRGGQIITDLSEAMREVTTAVRRESKPGTLTFTVSFSPAGRSGAMEFSGDIKKKIPTATAQSTLAFVTEDGALQRNDPNQIELPLRAIAGGAVETTELKTVTAMTA